MRRVTDFPCAAEEHRHLAIPMLDGTTLSARLWLPEGALRTPVPAILEYIPYRKNDATYPRDAEVHRHFAGHGYASVRLDIRGSGESEGIMTDEYTEQELQDGFDAIQWLAHATRTATKTAGEAGAGKAPPGAVPLMHVGQRFAADPAFGRRSRPAPGRSPVRRRSRSRCRWSRPRTRSNCRSARLGRVTAPASGEEAFRKTWRSTVPRDHP